MVTSNIESINEEKFLDAVSWAESRNDADAVGDKGSARGMFQFHEVTWMHVSMLRERQGLMTYSYKYAFVPEVAEMYAKSYFKWVKFQYIKEGIYEPTPTQLYLAYGMGFEGAKTISFDINRAPKHKQRANQRMLERYTK